MFEIVITGFILGLTSNLHCIGMCGPIAMAIPMNRTNNLTILSGTLQYNSGRILTYAILGMIVGSIGLTLNTFGILQWLSIAAGIGLIIFAWHEFLKRHISVKLPKVGIQSRLNSGFGKIIRSKSPFKLILLGALNGLLPCGMVFLGLINAIRAGEIMYSGLAMAAFGVATLPSMIFVTFMANKINGDFRQKLNRIVPYMLTIVGILVVLRGMNLNIPYISPGIQVVEQTSTSDQVNETVEMSCCHSKSDCK